MGIGPTISMVTVMINPANYLYGFGTNETNQNENMYVETIVGTAYVKMTSEAKVVSRCWDNVVAVRNKDNSQTAYAYGVMLWCVPPDGMSGLHVPNVGAANTIRVRQVPVVTKHGESKAEKCLSRDVDCVGDKRTSSNK